MNKLEEIKEKLRNELCLAFICNDKNGYIDCYYDEDQEKTCTIFDMEQMNTTQQMKMQFSLFHL